MRIKNLKIMIRILFCLCFFLSSLAFQAQISSKYTIAFENAVHHEANIQAIFTNLKSDSTKFSMSRSSPGRYALHEFPKNVYNIKVTDGKGNPLEATRPNPYSWNVTGHDGTIHVSYTLFGNHGDGTYAQIDETHAHLNLPATFIYVPELQAQEIEVTFDVREDLNWKIATQLKHQQNNTYYAKDFQYFMDSPIELANFKSASWQVKDATGAAPGFVGPIGFAGRIIADPEAAAVINGIAGANENPFHYKNVNI